MFLTDIVNSKRFFIDRRVKDFFRLLTTTSNYLFTTPYNH